MENEKEVKTFKIDGIRLPDKEGNVSGNHIAGYKGTLTITISQPKKELDRYIVYFSTKIPDHIYDVLNKQTIERNRGGMKSEMIKNTYNDMAKTIKRNSLEALVEYFNSIVDDYLWLMNNKKKPKKKTIFILFKKGLNNVSTYNGANAGSKITSRFSYFVGYDNGESLFDINFKSFNIHQDTDILEYKKIEWTKEREDFICKLNNQLEQAMQKVSDYIEQISNEKLIDILLLSDEKLLG
jgi:hypothetical protein